MLYVFVLTSQYKRWGVWRMGEFDYRSNYPVNNDVNQIKIFLKNKSPKVIFCTYQSSNLVEEAMLDKNKDFDH